MSVAAEQWVSRAMVLIAEFDKKQDKIYKHAGWKRVGIKVATPVGCLPCFLWSFICRLLACPCMCACKGPGFMCSDNGCTTLTDNCFAASWTTYDDIVLMEKMPVDVPKESLKIIAQSIEKYKYLKGCLLCEMLFKNTLEHPYPFNVMEFINKM